MHLHQTHMALDYFLSMRTYIVILQIYHSTHSILITRSSL